MANSIQGQGVNTVNINGFTSTLNFATQLVPLGSGSWQESVQVNTGTFQPVYTASIINDVGTVYIRNPGPGTIQVAVSSSGSGSLGVFSPNDWANTSWSGSIGIYARAFDSASFVNFALFSN